LTFSDSKQDSKRSWQPNAPQLQLVGQTFLGLAHRLHAFWSGLRYNKKAVDPRRADGAPEAAVGRGEISFAGEISPAVDLLLRFLFSLEFSQQLAKVFTGEKSRKYLRFPNAGRRSVERPRRLSAVVRFLGACLRRGAWTHGGGLAVDQILRVAAGDVAEDPVLEKGCRQVGLAGFG